MDHRGPEHHYNDLENQDSSATFFQQGEIQPETVETKDGERPFRGTPNGVRSEITERNTPLDGNSEDRGGNPTQTGILAKSIIEEAQEEAEQKTDPTEPAGLGELHPMKDNTWKPGDRLDRGQGRDEMLGSVRHADFKGDDDIWNQVVNDFESVENHGVDEDSTGKVASASWLEDNGFDSNVPNEHLGWDIVDVVEPNREVLEAQNKYSMPIPNGITDNLHNALVKLNAWVENPEEEGKLRPYKEYWSVIRPKFDKENSMQIGVENPRVADIINHIARTDDTSPLEETESMDKQAASAAARIAPTLLSRIGVGAAEGGGVGGAMGSALNFGKNMALYNGVSNMAGDATNAVGGFLGTGGDPSAGQMTETPGDFGVVTASDHFSDESIPEGPMSWEVDPPNYSQPEQPQPQGQPQGQQGTKTIQQMPDGSLIDTSTNQKLDPNLYSYDKKTKEWYRDPNKGFNWYQKGYVGLKTLQNAFNNPNEAVQTQGVTQPIRGAESFGVTQSKVATYGDEYEHPSSITRRIEDPVNGGIDPHQRTDESNDDWAYDMLDVNEIGQSRNGEDKLWSESAFYNEDTDAPEDLYSPAIERFLMMLPLVHHFFNSEDAGIDDEFMKSLHEDLDSEFPDYLNSGIPNEHERILFILDPENQNKDKSKKKSNTTFGPEPIAKPTMVLGEESSATQGKCHNCGTVLDASEEFCPKCSAPSLSGNEAQGATNPNWPNGTVQNLIQDNRPTPQQEFMEQQMREQKQMQQQLQQSQIIQQMQNKKFTSNEQGPHTDEQQAAVAELLIENDREKEIPNMIENSHDYADELAEVQNKQPMLDEDVEDQPGPAQEQPMQNQGMPPGMPPMGAPTPADLGTPGPAAGPAPGVMASMLKSAFKHGADSIAGKCPKCDSHTTKMIKQDGNCKCHTCGHDWKDDSFDSADGHSTDLSSTSSLEGSNEDYNSWSSFDQKPDYESELDQSLPHDENEFLIGENEKNPTWSTDWISELEERYPQVANMSDADRHKFFEKRGLGNVPTGDLLEKEHAPEDIGKAASLDSFAEPEEELEIDDSTHEWVDENGEPLKEGKEYEIYAHDYDIPDVGRVVEIKPDAIVYEIESDGGLRTTIEIDRQEADQNGYRFVESGVGSEENSPGIEENMDSKPVPVPGQTTDLSTPHIQIGSSTKISFEDYDEALVTEAIEWFLSLDGPYVFNEFEGLSQEEYQDEILNMHPDYILRAVDQHYGGGLDQLARDAGIVSQDDNPEEGLSAFGKIAGRHYTPMEQRELIDEYGKARNADKLNLENTHYAQADDDYFLFGC